MKQLMKESDEYRLKEGLYKGCGTIKLIQWDITIKASNDIKDEIRCVDKVSDTKRVLFLEQQLPRYVWCIRIRYNHKESAIIFIDATDSVRGVCVVGVLFYDEEMQEIARYASANSKKVARDPLVKALCAY